MKGSLLLLRICLVIFLLLLFLTSLVAQPQEGQGPVIPSLPVTEGIEVCDPFAMNLTSEHGFNDVVLSSGLSTDGVNSRKVW